MISRTLLRLNACAPWNPSGNPPSVSFQFLGTSDEPAGEMAHRWTQGPIPGTAFGAAIVDACRSIALQSCGDSARFSAEILREDAPGQWRTSMILNAGGGAAFVS